MLKGFSQAPTQNDKMGNLTLSQPCQQFLGLSAWRSRSSLALGQTGMAVSAPRFLASHSQTCSMNLGAESSGGANAWLVKMCSAFQQICFLSPYPDTPQCERRDGQALVTEQAAQAAITSAESTELGLDPSTCCIVPDHRGQTGAGAA